MKLAISPFHWICAAVVAAQAGLGLAIARFGPAHPIPIHFNADGVANRWGSRTEVATIVVATALASALLAGVAGALSRRSVVARRDAAGATRAAQIVILIAASAVALLSAALAFGWGAGGRSLTMFGLCAMFAAIGAYLGKVGPNALVGVRTPWTFTSRLAWDKANRLAGRLLFWGGLAGAAAAPVAPQPQGFRAMTFGVLAIAAIAVFESWRGWRNDSDRTSAM
jgi:uncharacterized membrane protein